MIFKRWNIPLGRANNTVSVTTERGVRHVANSSIMRRFRTNRDRTVLLGTVSQCGNKFAQVFGTSYDGPVAKSLAGQYSW